jgi:hypothetical protein
MLADLAQVHGLLLIEAAEWLILTRTTVTRATYDQG